MGSSDNQARDIIALQAPVILLTLAATAMPMEFRPWGSAALDFSISAPDVLTNILAYVPLGFVLAGLGLLRAPFVAALISIFAETSQLVMAHRFSSPIDVGSNVIGAILGTIVGLHWEVRSLPLRIRRRAAWIAVAIVCVVAARVWVTSAAVNSRGAVSAGTLEAHWKFDESGATARDSSGHGLDGRFSKRPKRITGAMGAAVALDGASDYINFGHPTALRITGNMTIMAWINSSSFPADDAAVVSQTYDKVGFQLDTTVDKGPREIGFKLNDQCGNRMARYGATPLLPNVWYHVAGVYNAEAQTMDVYLNGRLDNGVQSGSVTRAQRSSRANVYVGRRSDLEGFDFAGSVDDIRIYSIALGQAEIAAVMRGKDIQWSEQGGESVSHRRDELAVRCALSEPVDAEMPIAAAVVGIAVAIACVGFWPSIASTICAVVSLVAGFLLVSLKGLVLPAFNLWTIPLLSLLGGLSVALSRRRR